MSTAGAGQSKWVPYYFLAPFMLVFLAFTAYPLVQSVFLSMHQTYGPKSSVYVGFDNFANLAKDPVFWKAVSNTLLYTAGSLFLQLPLSLGLAMLLNQSWLRGRIFFRLVFFSPSLIGIAFVAILFSPMFAKNTGLLNVLLNQLHSSFDLEFGWMEEYVLWGLIVASLWMYVGFNMVYFLAALQNVDQGLADAAQVDGAGPWHRFLHVTVPAIRPIASFVILLSIIGSLQLFELPYVLLNFSGGPGNNGLTIVTYLYQIGFEAGDLGYASAIGWCLAIILMLVAIAQRQYLKGHEE